MSVSLISQPNIYQPAFNPVQFTFSSTNVSQCDFAFVADVYINGSFVIRLKEFPNSPMGYGVFDVSKILGDFLSFDFDPEIENFTPNPKSICDYYLEVRERYNTSADCNGSSSTGPVSYTTSKKYAWNGALQYHEQPLYDQDKYSLVDLESRFLTNSPEQINIGADEHYVLKFIQGLSGSQGSTYDLLVQTFDVQDNMINAFTKLNPFYDSETTEELLLSIPAGPANIQDFVTINPSVAYYTITIRNDGGDVVSETKRFNINDRCTKYKKYRFWWLNELGGFDALTFDMKSFRTMDIARNNYTKFLKRGYVIGDRGESVIKINTGSSYSVSSDFIREDDAVWIESLFTSPEVYVFESDSKSIRAKIMSAVCDCPQIYDITGAVYHIGHADIIVDDGGVVIPNGSFFNYNAPNLIAIGTPTSGVLQISGYAGSGQYHTELPSTINAGAVITGTMQQQDASCSVTLGLAGSAIPIGTPFSYTVKNGSTIGLNDVGTGTIIGYGPNQGDHLTDLNCTIEAGSLITGSLKYEKTDKTLIPIIITNQTYEEKLRSNTKGIQYTIEFRTSYKKNVQSL